MTDSSETFIELFWDVLKRYFEKASSRNGDDNEPVLTLNDLEEVEHLLQEVAYECSEEKPVEPIPLLSKIDAFITEQSWERGAQITWLDFKKLTAHVEPWKFSEEKPLEDLKHPEAEKMQYFWDNLQQSFLDASTVSTDTDEAAVSLSDVKEVERIMQSAINASSKNTNVKQLSIVEQITDFMEKQAWEPNVSVSWTDFKKLVDYIEPWKVLEHPPITSTESEEPANQPWSPLFAPNTFAADLETVQRKRLLAVANKEDAERAAKAMKIELAQMSKNAAEDTLLEDWALQPDKIAVDCYYKHLRSIVVGEPKQDNTAIVPPLLVNATTVESTTAVTLESATCTALNNLIAGESLFKLPKEVVLQTCEYFSSFQITTAVPEQTSINFQGALVWCDSTPKPVKATAKQVANAILIDKTGPILVQAWSDLAGQLCDWWKEMELLRAQGMKNEKGNIIDLQRVKVAALPNNGWHGASLTNIRVLSTVAVPNQPKLGTSVQRLTQATQPNMTTAEFPVLPAHSCIKIFSGYREKFEAPFRATCMGTIADMKSIEVTQTGNRKELVFDSHSYA